MKKIILMGPPGSGKGTISDVLVEKLNLPHISSGDILRHAMNKDTDEARKLKAMMATGDLIPDEIVDNLLKETIQKDAHTKGFILDGYPRHLGQAKKLVKMVDIDEVVVVDISDEEIIKRLEGRRSCPNCGEAYHIVNIPPKVEGICDKCGTKLIQRADAKKIEHRLDLYHKETEPIIAFYKTEGIKVKKVPGNFNVKTERDMIANLVAN